MDMSTREVSSWIDPTASEFEIPYVCKSISWSLEEFSLLLVVPICVDSLNIRCVYHQLSPLSLTIQIEMINVGLRGVF